MLNVSRTFTVSPPPDLVVEYLKDFAHAQQWVPGTRSCERIDSGPVAEGAFWHNVSKVAGRTAELTYTLEELTDRRVVFVGENHSSRTVDTITVESDGEGSAITFASDLETLGMARLMSPIRKMAFEKRARETEAQLSSVLNALPVDRSYEGGARR